LLGFFPFIANVFFLVLIYYFLCLPSIRLTLCSRSGSLISKVYMDSLFFLF